MQKEVKRQQEMIEEGKKIGCTSCIPAAIAAGGLSFVPTSTLGLSLHEGQDEGNACMEHRLLLATMSADTADTRALCAHHSIVE